MPDMAWGHNERDEPTQSPQDMLGAEYLRDVAWRLDAILQCDHTRLWPNQWTDGLDRLTDLPGFHAQHDDIHDAHFSGIIRRLHWRDGSVPFDTLHIQSMNTQGMQVLPAGEKDHLFSSLGQTATKIAANPADTNDRNPHHAFLLCATTSAVRSTPPAEAWPP